MPIRKSDIYSKRRGTGETKCTHSDQNRTKSRNLTDSSNDSKRSKEHIEQEGHHGHNNDPEPSQDYYWKSCEKIFNKKLC